MKTATHLFSIKPVVVALAVALGASSVSLPVLAAGKVTEEVTRLQFARWGDPAMAQIAVNSGRALVGHLTSAKALLDNGQVEQARSALQVSHEFADTIERIMPYLTVVEDVVDLSNQVIEEKISALKVDLLPIYASLDEMEVFAPEAAHQARAKVKQAEKHAAANDKAGVVKELREAAAVVEQHTVYLPVGYVDQQVRVAQHAINQTKPDLPTAKAAVGRALGSLSEVVDAVVQTAAR